MSADAEKLRNEIERLEKELETQHFTALFDQKGYDHKLKRLKKLRKQLAELEGTRERLAPVVKPPKPAPAAKKKPAKQAAARKPATKKSPTKTTRKPAKKTATKKTATKKTTAKKTTKKKASGK